MQAAVPAGTPKRGNWRLALQYILTSPRRAFEAIAAGASWWWGWLATVVVMWIGYVPQLPYIRLYMSEQFGFTNGASGFEAKLRIAEIVLAACMPLILIMMFAVGAAFFFLVLWLAGIRIGFTPLMRVMAYTGVLVPGLQELMKGIAIQFKHRAGTLLTAADSPRMGLDMFGGEGTVKGILAAFDFISIWWLVVLALGFPVLTRRKASQVVPVVLGAGILWLVLSGVVNRD